MLQTPQTPLVLKARGSFFVGGERVERTAVELGRVPLGPGHITIDQMYVEYMVPETASPKVPIIMVHGSTLSGQSWQTTPDGRMGWDEYFVRKGHPVYLVDQVSRGRSGFDSSVFNKVREGVEPPSAQPAIFRGSDELTWKAWRIGPSYGVPFEDTQFPVEVADELSKYGIPDVNALLPLDNPTYAALAALALELGGAVVMGHSQGGVFPMQAALADPRGIKALVMIEGGATLAGLSDEQVSKLVPLPMLSVYGDHLDADSGVPGFSRRALYEACWDFIKRVNAEGGNVEMLYPPDLGIFGNTHMVMFDKNSFEIADLVIRWIDKNVA